MSEMTEQDIDELRRYVVSRYDNSGQPEQVLRELHAHNDRCLAYAEAIASGESLSEADAELLVTMAVLHDVAKAETHLMLHAQAGGDLAANKLRELGKDETFVKAVEQGIRAHMGPFPFVDEEARKYTERTGGHLHLPRPQTRIEQLFYDSDMLALIDPQGIEKVVVLRATTPEFVAEDEATAAEQGITPRAAAYASALQSVQRAAGSLFSDTAHRIATELVSEAERHITDSLADDPAPSPSVST